MIGVSRHRRRAMSSGRLAARPRRWRGKRQHGPEHAAEAQPIERRLQKTGLVPKICAKKAIKFG